MTISRRQSHQKVYTIRNASDQQRPIIIEHPITHGALLVEPANADSQTAALYRFNRTLNAHATLTFTVREETPLYQRVTLAHLHPEAFLSFAANQEIPANVREVLARAIELQRAASAAAAAVTQLEAQRVWLIAEQGRIRLNMEAVEIECPHGQDFLNRLVALDNDIISFNTRIQQAQEERQRAQQEYENFLAAIDI
jgi:hypothetical protein